MLKYIIMLTVKVSVRMERLEAECANHKVAFYYALPEEETLIKETLYITDHQEIYEGLVAEGANVLVWLHEENREEDLGAAAYAVEDIEEAGFFYLEKIYRRLRKLPWQIADTGRCIIREMTEEDINDIYDIYRGKSITRFMEGLFEDREKELEYIRSYIRNAYEFYGYGTWLVERKEDGRIIGRVGYNLREGYEEPELGFVIAEEFQQKGYAYECCRGILKIAKPEYEFTRIQALVKEENLASVRLCEKLGFYLKERVMEEGQEYLRMVKQL